jgi:hypothetical protein
MRRLRQAHWKAAVKCHGDKPTCQRRDKCQHACDLRVQYVEGYAAGRAATVAQWADHMKRMNEALMAIHKPPNAELSR